MNFSFESPTSRYYETVEDFRNPYERDRDRIIHSSSFRKLEYKTQVFLNSEGDYFRTRLTHSLEVSQIAKTIAKHLGLNENLAEAIALAHDIGHTPFGHIGGDELDRVMRECGSEYGFEHNFQSFRVLTKLEKRYGEFDGLNLTYATLEGVLKHSAPYKKSFLPSHFDELFMLGFHPSFEAVIVDNADSIAYISADIDDALNYQLITYEELEESLLAKEIIEKARRGTTNLEEPIFRYKLSSGLISAMVYDFLQNSQNNGFKNQQNCAANCSKIAADVPIGIGFSPAMTDKIKCVKELLYKKVYKHERIVKKMFFGKTCINGLFRAFISEPSMLPPQYKKRAEEGGKINRIVADFIANLSDRGAMQLYRELY